MPGPRLYGKRLTPAFLVQDLGYYYGIMQITLPTRAEIHAAYIQGEEAVVSLFGELGKQVEALAEVLSQQGEAIKDVEGCGGSGV